MEDEDEGGGLFDFGQMEKEEEDRVASRCKHERQRTPIIWQEAAQPIVSSPNTIISCGMFYKMEFPVSEYALQQLGANWLTAAMHAARTLAGGNSVLSLSRVHRLGNASCGAMRFLLLVEYVEEHVSVHNELIAKIGTGISARNKHKYDSVTQKNTMQSDAQVPFPFAPSHASDYFTEINFYRLCEDRSPYEMPKFYFGDICSKTGKSILITEFIPLPEDIKFFHSFGYVDVCLFQDPRGDLLGCSENSVGTLHVSREERVSKWSLERQDADGTKVLLRSFDGRYLAVRRDNDRRAACYLWESLDLRGIELAHWSFEPEDDGFRIKSQNNSYLVARHGSIVLSSDNADEHSVWRIIPVQPKIVKCSYNHFDLKNMSYTECKSMMCHGAELAGMYKTGELGNPELLDQSFSGFATNSIALDIRSLNSSTFSKKAEEAEDFIGRVGVAALLQEATNQKVMMEYRLMLAIVQANAGPMTEYLSSQVDYVALGRGHMHTNSAFSSDQTTWTCGFRDWDCMSVGPLGMKIWDWLRYAESSVFEVGIDDLLIGFISVYRNSGGPSLDFSKLRMHFVIAGALESLRLLHSLSEIYSACPPAHWSSIKNLDDRRILDVDTPHGSLWECVKAFANIAWLLKSLSVTELMFNAVIPAIVPMWRLQSKPIHFLLVKEQAEVRDAPGASSAFLASLNQGTLVLCPSTYAKEEADGYVRIVSPLGGWMSAQQLVYMYLDECNQRESNTRTVYDARLGEGQVVASVNHPADAEVAADADDKSDQEAESEHCTSGGEEPSAGTFPEAGSLAREESMSQAVVLTLLRNQTGGEFESMDDLQVAAPSKLWSNSEHAISVISPTGSARHHFHPFLYRCFCQQLYQHKELVVVDTGDMSSSPSAYFTQGPPAHDPRVVYKHFKTKKEWSIGAKRNAACYFARGSVIVHFDDDDVYTPKYLSLIMSVLQSGSNEMKQGKLEVSVFQEATSHISLPRLQDFAAEATTFQKWFTFSVGHTPRWGYYFPSLEEGRKHVFGYGFSFAYLKSAWYRSPFDNINLGEDTEFFESLLAKGARIALLRDHTGICAHIYHQRNCSGMEDSQITSQAMVSKELLNATRRLQTELKVPTPISAPREVALEDCVAGLRELVDIFKTPELQAEFHNALRKKSSQFKYDNELRQIVLKHQISIMPKYGFEASLAGVLECHRSWTTPALYKLDEHSLVRGHQFVIQWLRNPHWQQEDVSTLWNNFMAFDRINMTAGGYQKLNFVLHLFDRAGIFIRHQNRR